VSPNPSHPFFHRDAFFQDDNNLYLLLEFIQGGELFSHLRQHEKFDDDVAKFYCLEVAVALNKMHSIHIAYRDIKPENLMLGTIISSSFPLPSSSDSYGHIRLVDFGFAKVINDRTFTLCGTPEYLAPEVIAGDGYGCAVDWWAMGVLLYEMVVGYPPFYDQNPFGVYKKILKGSIKFPNSGVTSSAQSAIKGFLTQRRYRRLGCTTQSPIDSLRKHSYFQSIDWNSAEKMLITPPYLPTVLSAGDTSNFDYYPEETTEETSNLSSTERIAFAELDLILDRPAGASCK
jgi:serine/threonine protein kinase